MSLMPVGQDGIPARQRGCDPCPQTWVVAALGRVNVIHVRWPG